MTRELELASSRGFLLHVQQLPDLVGGGLLLVFTVVLGSAACGIAEPVGEVCRLFECHVESQLLDGNLAADEHGACIVESLHLGIGFRCQPHSSDEDAIELADAKPCMLLDGFAIVGCVTGCLLNESHGIVDPLIGDKLHV